MSASGWIEKKIEGTTTWHCCGSGLKEEVHCDDYVWFIHGNLSFSKGFGA